MLDLRVDPVRQCAWCWLIVDQSGAYAVQPGHKIKSATHGICPACKLAVRAEIESGELATAA